MNQKRIKTWINILMFVIIISIILFILTKPDKVIETDEEIVKCIAEKSTLYTQLGCHACGIQEDLFGKNYKYLDVVDCFYELDKCSGIEATPSWKIKREFYRGVHTIKQLQELTEC